LTKCRSRKTWQRSWENRGKLPKKKKKKPSSFVKKEKMKKYNLKSST